MMITSAEQQIIDELAACFYKQRTVLTEALQSAQSLGEWSCVPPSGVPSFEWYKTLHRKVLNTKKRLLVTSPDVNVLLEHSLSYRPVIDNNLTGIYQAGTLENLLVFVDPFFPTNQILFGDGSLDDPENLMIRDCVKLQVTYLLDSCFE